jgi:xanthine dehydrogenase molybdopterin-binding subunit B
LRAIEKETCKQRPSTNRFPLVILSLLGHSFVFKYKASAKVTADGAKLDALDIELYANGGYAFDLSGPVVDRALFHVDGCYMFPSFRAVGVVCKTSQPPHTAFRGFGGPQVSRIELVTELWYKCHCLTPRICFVRVWWE